jgi:hydrogenase expression/formation protein HypC
MCLGIPGRVVEIYDETGLHMGVVDFGGVRREVCLAYLADELEPGDYAIVHVGFAISRVDEEEARRTLELLREMGALEELEDEGAPGAPGPRGSPEGGASPVEGGGP